MSNLKEDVLKLPKAEQYEIYEAIESKLFGEEQQTLTKEQMALQKFHLIPMRGLSYKKSKALSSFRFSLSHSLF